MQSQRILGIALIGIFATLVIITVGRINRYKFKHTAPEMLEIVQQADYTIRQSALDSLSKNSEASLSIIDLREPETYEVGHPEGAINIPLSILLDDESLETLLEAKQIVLYHTDTRVAHQAWMLLTQIGYQELLVMEIAPGKETGPVIPVLD